MFPSLVRRAPLLLWLSLLLFLSPLRAQNAVDESPVQPTEIANALGSVGAESQNAAFADDQLADGQAAKAQRLKLPREGTPTFLGAVDTTLQTWSRYFRGYSIYALVAIALLAAYLTGLIIYQIAFGFGAFAPKAGVLAAWFGAIILLFFGLMMLPQTWPWWSPYALIFFGIALTALLLSSFSKKAV